MRGYKEEGCGGVISSYCVEKFNFFLRYRGLFYKIEGSSRLYSLWNL
jgi:hypothetical protein